VCRSQFFVVAVKIGWEKRRRKEGKKCEIKYTTMRARDTFFCIYMYIYDVAS
jgi:hypothetical protein